MPVTVTPEEVDAAILRFRRARFLAAMNALTEAVRAEDVACDLRPTDTIA
jgi:hypothetical protein